MQDFMNVSNQDEYLQYRLDFIELEISDKETIFAEMRAMLEELRAKEAQVRAMFTPRQVESALRDARRRAPRRRFKT